MIAGSAMRAWDDAGCHGKEKPVVRPEKQPAAAMMVTPAMRAKAKYCWLVRGLFLVQILLGATTAHYQIKGQEAYGFALADYLPYAVTRSWHTQLAILWIATAWLATGLYLGPALSGHHTTYQKLGGTFLFLRLTILLVC